MYIYIYIYIYINIYIKRDIRKNMYICANVYSYILICIFGIFCHIFAAAEQHRLVPKLAPIGMAAPLPAGWQEFPDAASGLSATTRGDQ